LDAHLFLDALGVVHSKAKAGVNFPLLLGLEW
jgi:hypothetical protein